MTRTVRKFGVEIEGYTDEHVDEIYVNGVYWDADSDGSLDQDDKGMYGREVKSPPINDLSQIEEAYRVLKGDYGWWPNGYGDDSRTDAGLHVHVDAEDLNPVDAYKLLALMTMVEPILYSITNESRFNNIYCCNLIRYSDSVNSILSLGERNGASRCDYLFAAYARPGLNFHALGRHNTVEFRYFYPQTEAEKVMQYVEIVTRLVDFVHFAEVDQIFLLVKALLVAEDFDAACAVLQDSLEIPFHLASLKENDIYEKQRNNYKAMLSNLPALENAQ